MACEVLGAAADGERAMREKLLAQRGLIERLPDRRVQSRR